jgi:hypothetical protein
MTLFDVLTTGDLDMAKWGCKLASRWGGIRGVELLFIPVTLIGGLYIYAILHVSDDQNAKEQNLAFLIVYYYCNSEY